VRLLLRGYFVGNDLQMWENSGIFRLFLLPVMQSVYCVGKLQIHHGQKNGKEAQLAGTHGIC